MMWICLAVIYWAVSVLYLVHYDLRAVKRVTLADLALDLTLGWFFFPFVAAEEFIDKAKYIVVFRRD
jgi:hypothetical protein